MIHAFWLVVLNLPTLLVLFLLYRKTRIPAMLSAFLMLLIFVAVYMYIGFLDPPIEEARTFARQGFVFMSAIGCAHAIKFLMQWLYDWRNKSAP